MNTSVVMTLKKETKGTVVYANEEKGFSGVYVPKDMLPAGKVPGSITLTITCEE